MRFPAEEDRVWHIVTAVVLFGAVLQIPGVLEPTLDNDWRMALAHALHASARFGDDIVFTYGPLGALTHPAYIGTGLATALAFQLALAGAFAALAIGLMARPRWASRFFVLCYGGLLVAFDRDFVVAMVSFLAAIALIRRLDDAAGATRFALVATLAVLALSKFTDFAANGLFVAIAATYSAVRRQWGRVALVALAYVAVLCVAWAASGQALSGLPAYVLSSIEVSRGYGAMALPPVAATFECTLAVLAALASYLAFRVYHAPHDPRVIALTTVAAAFLLLQWKGAVVRADPGHIARFLVTSLVLVVGFPRLLDDAWPGSEKAIYSLLGLVALLVVVTLYEMNDTWARPYFSAMVNRVRADLALLASPGSFEGRLRRELDEMKARELMPATRAAVGHSTIDVLGFSLDAALLNDLAYRPRPTLQSYAADTPRLALRNRDYLLSSAGPAFLLQRIEAIDDRPPTIEDGPTLRDLPRYFEPTGTERGFVLWRRRAAVTGVPFEPVDKMRLAANRRVALDRYGNGPLWVEMEVTLSPLGRMRAWLYQPPQVFLRVEDEIGGVHSYRLPPSMAPIGFLMSPVIVDTRDYAALATGRSLLRARAIELVVTPDQARYLEPEVGVQLYTRPAP
jgi:hypothetical protein